MTRTTIKPSQLQGSLSKDLECVGKPASNGRRLVHSVVECQERVVQIRPEMI